MRIAKKFIFKFSDFFCNFGATKQDKTEDRKFVLYSISPIKLEQPYFLPEDKPVRESTLFSKRFRILLNSTTMQRKLVFGCLIAFACFGTTLSAQSASIETDLMTSTSTLAPISDNNWSFFHDEDTHTYFIDFQTISLNLSEIVVKNEMGEIVIREDVIDLPVNSIFEINCSQFEKGEYTVELRSYTKNMSKKIAVK